MPGSAAITAFHHDVFISYSRRDRDFAKALETALKSFSPPKDLPIPHRRLQVFRDEADITAGEYHRELNPHLKHSNKLLVICSPDAATSKYVDEEISVFVEADQHNPENIIPVLLRGLPNNEITSGHENDAAFPPSLCKAMPMPLAANYLDFTPAKQRVSTGAYANAWYSVLAKVYGVSRAEIERRDLRRKRRLQGVAAAVTAVIFAALSLALVFTIKARQRADRERDRANVAAEEATRQRDRATLAAAEASAERANAVRQRDVANDERQMALLALARSSVQQGARLFDEGHPSEAIAHFAKAQRIVPDFLPAASWISDLLIGRVWWLPGAPLRHHGIISSAAFSPDGRRVVTASEDNTAQVWDAKTGKPLGAPMQHQKTVFSAAFSSDGRRVVTASDLIGAQIWDADTGKPLGAPMQHQAQVWRAALAPTDGAWRPPPRTTRRRCGMPTAGSR